MEPQRSVVETVARAVVGDPSASLVEWSGERLKGGVSEEVGLSEGLRRVSGVVATGGDREHWSAMAKSLRRTVFEVGGMRPDIDDPHGVHYWRREADAYASGVLDDTGDGLSAARGYHLEDMGDEVIVWMEEVVAEAEGPWPLDRYWIAAEHLGRFNGHFAGRVPEGVRPWASRGRLIDWVSHAAAGIERMRSVSRSGLLETWLSDRSVARIERLFRERERLMRALEPLPETLCHHDAHRRNLLSVRREGRQQTIAVDWAMTGTGRLGEDLAVLSGVSLQFLDVPMSDHVEFEAAVIDGYVSGLRASGWTGDETILRSGYKAALGLLMGVLAAGVWFSGLSEVDDADFAEHVIGRSAVDIGGQWAEMQPYLLDLAEEALLTAPAA